MKSLEIIICRMQYPDYYSIRYCNSVALPVSSPRADCGAAQLLFCFLSEWTPGQPIRIPSILTFTPTTYNIMFLIVVMLDKTKIWPECSNDGQLGLSSVDPRLATTWGFSHSGKQARSIRARAWAPGHSQYQIAQQRAWPGLGLARHHDTNPQHPSSASVMQTTGILRSPAGLALGTATSTGRPPWCLCFSSLHDQGCFHQKLVCNFDWHRLFSIFYTPFIVARRPFSASMTKQRRIYRNKLY